MTAIPIIPGQLYRVRGKGLDRWIFAHHPCEAINVVLTSLEALA